MPFTPDLRDRWLKFLLHVKFSPDPDTGVVALYGDLDGRGVRPLLPPTDVPTLKVDEDEDVIDSHARIGITATGTCPAPPGRGSTATRSPAAGRWPRP